LQVVSRSLFVEVQQIVQSAGLRLSDEYLPNNYQPATCNL
jgi:hypothetical protein